MTHMDGLGQPDFIKRASERAVDASVEAILPKQPGYFLFGGVALIGVSRAEFFENSALRYFLTVGGGIAIGIGVLPILWGLYKGKPLKLF